MHILKPTMLTAGAVTLAACVASPDAADPALIAVAAAMLGLPALGWQLDKTSALPREAGKHIALGEKWDAATKTWVQAPTGDDAAVQRYLDASPADPVATLNFLNEIEPLGEEPPEPQPSPAREHRADARRIITDENGVERVDSTVPVMGHYGQLTVGEIKAEHITTSKITTCPECSTYLSTDGTLCDRCRRSKCSSCKRSLGFRVKAKLDGLCNYCRERAQIDKLKGEMTKAYSGSKNSGRLVVQEPRVDIDKAMKYVERGVLTVNQARQIAGMPALEESSVSDDPGSISERETAATNALLKGDTAKRQKDFKAAQGHYREAARIQALDNPCEHVYVLGHDECITCDQSYLGAQL